MHNLLKISLSLLAICAITTDADACTSLIAGRGATDNGSTMITYAADSHVLYGELYEKQGGTHAPGTMRPIVDWDTHELRGEIPEAPVTYNRIGNMNEHGVTIGESTWACRPELEGSGMIDYGSLIFIALERAKTAREAVDIMTDLAEKYGYGSEGESFSIADPDEVWFLEMVGKGKDDPGAVWVARRVPDNAIAGHANHSRIHTFPLDDKENTLYSDDVISFARRMGYYDGKDSDFDFSRAYAVYDLGALRGCDGRVWAYFTRFAPQGEMDSYLPWITEGLGDPMPLWIVPEKKVSANDLKWMMRDHFEGTPLDMNNDIGAGPFHVPYRWRPLTYVVDGNEYTHERAIATQQTGFSFVSDMNSQRPATMRGILWFGVDDANTGVYIPIFNSTVHAPYEVSEGNGDMLTLSWDALFWVNNYVANQAYNRYSQMIDDIRAVQLPLETEVESVVAVLPDAIGGLDTKSQTMVLDNVANYWANKVTKDYKALGDKLFVRYMDGNIKPVNDDGTFQRTATGMPANPKFGGYDERYYRSIVDEQGDRLKVIDVPQTNTPVKK